MKRGPHFRKKTDEELLAMAQRKAERRPFKVHYYAAITKEVRAKLEANSDSFTGTCEDCRDDREQEVWELIPSWNMCRDHAHKWANDPRYADPNYLVNQFFQEYKRIRDSHLVMKAQRKRWADENRLEALARKSSKDVSL